MLEDVRGCQWERMLEGEDVRGKDVRGCQWERMLEGEDVRGC